MEANIRTAEAQNQASQVKTSSFIEADMANRIQGLTESLARSQARLAETETKLTDVMTAKERLATQVRTQSFKNNEINQNVNKAFKIKTKTLIPGNITNFSSLDGKNIMCKALYLVCIVYNYFCFKCIKY